MIDLSQAYVRGLQKGYNAELNNNLAAQLARTDSLSSLMLESTDAAGVSEMEYDQAAGIPILQQVLGGRQETQNPAVKSVTVKNLEFTRLLRFSRTVLERNGAKVYMKDMRNAAVAFHLFKERRLAAQLNAGFTTLLDGTGAAFFSTAAKKVAKEKPGVTFINGTTLKFSETNFNAGVQNLMERTDAEGNSLGLGSDLVLVVGPKNRAAATEVVKLQRSTGGKDNPNYGIADLKVWPFLAPVNADAWFLFDKGFKTGVVQTEVPLSSYMGTNPDDAWVIMNLAFPFLLYFRGEVTLTEPLAIYGSNGTTGP